MYIYMQCLQNQEIVNLSCQTIGIRIHSTAHIILMNSRITFFYIFHIEAFLALAIVIWLTLICIPNVFSHNCV